MKNFSIQKSKDLDDILIIIGNQSVLSASSLPELDEALQETFDSSLFFVIIDLKEVTQIDTIVLQKFEKWQKKFCTEHRGDMCLINVSRVITKAIKKDQLDLHLFSDKSAAINYFYWEYKGHIDTFLFNLPPIIHLVPATRQIIRKAIEIHSYGSRTAYEVETIVDELLNNAIEHGVHGGKDDIEIAVAIGRDFLEVNISNTVHLVYDGVNSVDNPRKIEKTMRYFSENPVKDIAVKRGRGLGLITILSDSCEIDSSNEGTCVHIIKNREEQEYAE